MTKATTSIDDIVRDPNWLADRYDAEHDAIHFRRVDRDQHRAATFLTPEYLGEAVNPIAIKRSDVNAIAHAGAPLNFIFHSAFCCSTLLARAFDIPGRSMGLKEPLILNDIVGCLHRGQNKIQMRSVLKDALDLLARPFNPAEITIVKPSNIINALAPTIMDVFPDAKALLLYAPLPVYLKSIAKKGLTGRLWVRDLLIKQLKDNFIDLGFHQDDYVGLTDLQVAAVGWLSQQALFGEMRDSLGRCRVGLIDSETLLKKPQLTIETAANLFGVKLTTLEIESIVCGSSFSQNSKTGTPYSNYQREVEYNEASAKYADEIEKVTIWANVIASNCGIEVQSDEKDFFINPGVFITNANNLLANQAQTQKIRKLAVDAMRRGELNAALHFYQNLLEISSDNPDDWFNIGYIQRCMRHYEASIGSYRSAIKMGAIRPEEIHLNIAVIMSEHMNMIDMAIQEIELALSLNSEFIPALLNLANLFEDVGNRDQAKSCYDRILKLEPHNGRANGRRALIDVYYNESANVISDLKAKLSKSTRLDDRPELAFALGHALDTLGMYKDAFDAFRQANEAVLDSTVSVARYDRSSHESFIKSLVQVFDAPSKHLISHDHVEPIFICGMFRSGSTLAEQLLSRHSKVSAGGELEIMPALIFEQLMPYPLSLVDCDEQVYKKLGAEYLTELRSLFPVFDVITDKRPDNFLHIGLIKSIFPRAKIIHTKRNALDNILSIYFGNFSDAIRYSHNIDDIRHYYDQYCNLMGHWKALYPQDIFDLDYDRLVEEPNGLMAELLSFCELENETIDYREPTDGAIVKTLSSWQVRQKLSQKSSGRWKNYADQLKYFDPAS